MKSWRVAEPGELDCPEWMDIPVPVPADNQCLVQVSAAALNFSDLLMVRGKYQVKPPLPFTPGQEIAGTVVEAGSGSRFTLGQRLASKVFWGGFAEYALVDDDMGIPLPESISLEKAVTLPVVYTTAHIALHHRGHLSAGETILVHAGGGGVGLASVQVGKAAGAKVVATMGNPDKFDLVRSNGADLVLDYTSDDWIDEVNAFTDGKGANIIVDPVGGEVAEYSLNCIAWEGRHLIIGFAAGAVPKFPGHRLLLKNASAVGVYWTHENDGPVVEDATRSLVEMFQAGQIDPVIDTRFGLQELKTALRALDSRETIGKVVLTVDSD